MCTVCDVFVGTCVQYVMFVLVHVYVCVCYVCTYVFMYVCLFIYLRMYVCMYVSMCVFIYVRMCVCVYVCMYARICAYMYVNMCVYIYLCMYVQSYISIDSYTYVPKIRNGRKFPTDMTSSRKTPENRKLVSHTQVGCKM